jgi:large subunit ribosomal protein L15
MLHTIKPYQGAKNTFKRLARGNGSGKGTTAGRGTKGQQSRVGKGRRPGFEGGQTPLIRRQPKLGGFTNPSRVHYEVLNLDVLEKLPAGTYDAQALRVAKVLKTSRPVKLLGRGKITKKFALTVQAASKSAKELLEKAGGSLTIVR